MSKSCTVVHAKLMVFWLKLNVDVPAPLAHPPVQARPHECPWLYQSRTVVCTKQPFSSKDLSK